MRSPRRPRRLDVGLSLEQSPKLPSFPRPSLAITVLGRIVIGHRQLAPGSLLGQPAQLDDACPDQDVLRERVRSASHGVPVRRFWRWSGHLASLSRGRPAIVTRKMGEGRQRSRNLPIDFCYDCSQLSRRAR
jgi:hypothetical protein